jgi:membrane-bound inhibitor of C-type lysozyme
MEDLTMKTLAGIGAAFVASVVSLPAIAASPTQPPMGAFSDAFYTCDGGGAFNMSYDSNTPTQATMTTSDNNDQHLLKRTSVASGAEFSGGGVTFWTDGKARR